MKLYVVRHIDDKQGVGIFWADNEEDLIYLVDQFSDTDGCEFQLIEEECALGWYGVVPGLGVHRKDGHEGSDEIKRLFSKLEPLGALEVFFDEETEDDAWVPLCSFERRRSNAIRIVEGLESAAALPEAAVEPEKPRWPPDRPRVVPPALINRVYFIECSGHIKIGVTSGRIEKRMRALATAHHSELKLIATIENAPADLEFKLHQKFAAFRVRGEWFRFEGELKLWIEGGCNYEGI